MANSLGPFTIRAAAKFNLTLEVGQVQANGLHQVASVMADLLLADELVFEPRRGPLAVDCEGAEIATYENLAWRAAVALRPELRDWHILVRKRIPLQAGLGGGSADAAAVLRGVARIMECLGIPVVDARLRMIAPELGSDVAACLVSGLRIVAGTGELVTPIPSSAPPWGVLLLQPNARVPTADAYRLLDESRSATPEAHETHSQEICAAYAAHDFAQMCALMHNAFQSVIETAFPPVREARARLVSAGVGAALLCGSGSCVAGLFPTQAGADAALAALPKQNGEWTAVTGFGDGA